MRVLPLIERILLGAFVLLALILLAFVVTWHVRYRGIVDRAASPPWPGVVVPRTAANTPAMFAELDAITQVIFSSNTRAMPADEQSPTNADMRTMLDHNDPIIAPASAVTDERGLGLIPGPTMRRTFPLAPGLAARLRTLLDHGLVFGGIPADITAVDPTGIDPTMYHVDLARGAAVRWRMDGDLDALDALCAATGPACIVRDVYITESYAAVRDAAYVDAQLAGRIGSARLDAWRAENAETGSATPAGSRLARLYLDLDCQRRLWFPMDAALQFRLDPRAFAASHKIYDPPTLDEVLHDLPDWWALPGDCGRQCADVEAELAALDHGDTLRDPNEIVLYALCDLGRQRFAHLASAIAEAWMRRGQTPDQAALDLAPSVDRAALVLERLGPDTWTIGLDPVQRSPLGPIWLNGCKTATATAAIAAAPLPADRSIPVFSWSAHRLLVRLPVPPGPVTPGQTTAAP